MGATAGITSGGGGGGGSVDRATEADHATNADNATLADEAKKLTSDSTDWLKIARKDIAQTISEAWTFAKGIVSTLKSYFNGGIEVTGGTKTDTLTATGNATVGGTLGVTGNTTVGGTLGVAGNTTVGGTLGVTGKLNGHDADFEDVTMDNLGTALARVAKIWATAIDATNINAENTTTENLTVTKEAHFFKLVVDELLSNKGAIIITSANCVAEAVAQDSSVAGYYDVYFATVDGNGNSVSNSWRVGDLALCLTFKAEGAGTFSNVRNRYYWRKVLQVESNVTYNNETYHHIRLSNVAGEAQGSTVPAPSDNIVQLGYTGNDAAYRQSAIIISSYPTMDSGVTPPSLAFYKGINDFNLASHRYTFIDGLNNEFMGNFKILVNGNYENLTSVLATIEGLIMTVKGMVRGKNILPADGWTDYQGFLLGATNYNEQTQMFCNSDGEGSYDDMVWSPVFFLPAGTYTYSHYCSDPYVQLIVYGSSKQFTIDNLPIPDLVDIDIYTQRSGDVYQSKQRRYATFTLTNDAYVCLNIFLGDDEFTMYRPMLEEGNTCSDWETGAVEHTSQVKILANAINIAIRNGLQTTGIDITTGKVAVEADNFTVEKNGVQVFGVDTNTGVTTMQDVDIKGSLVYHKTLIDRSNNYYQLFDMYDENGNVVGLDYSGTVHKTVLKYDTIVIGGAERTASYNLFSGVVEYGYTIILPPAKLFQGMRIKIINGTVNSLSGQPAQQQLSKINFAVVYRSDTDTYDEESGSGYAMNNVASVTPVYVEMNNSQGVGTFVGAPQGNTFVRDYTPSSAEHFTCYGLSGDYSQSNPVRYKSFELVSQANPYTSSGYAWTIIELDQ